MIMPIVRFSECSPEYYPVRAPLATPRGIGIGRSLIGLPSGQCLQPGRTMVTQEAKAVN